MPVELTMNFEQVKNRLSETVAVQTNLSPAWVWENFTLLQWAEMQRQFDPLSTAPAPSLANKVKTANVDFNNARQAYENQLTVIQQITGVALSGLRGRAREDSVLAHSIAGLTSFSESRVHDFKAKLTEAQFTPDALRQEGVR